MTMMKRLFFSWLLGAFFLGLVPALSAQPPQQLAFAGLLSSGHQGQFNGVQADSAGNLYLLLDQKDGVRLLKTDSNATNILAQAHIGAQGDIGIALCLDPAGNVYVTGTTTSNSLNTTPGVAFPTRADTSTHSFVAKFDTSLNPIFVTYSGSGRTAAGAIAATADAVFITGSTFSNSLPFTPSAIQQSPASGSFQNGFVERFNATGTTLVYATYLTGLNGDTAPAAIAADSSDNAYTAGYTTSSGFPTLSAVVPSMLSNPSGFLTKLTSAGDGLTFSTFIPGDGITALSIDSSNQTLLLSGTIARGQFPITAVTTPLVNTTYQTLVRMPLDGSTVLSSTLLAPGQQSTITPSLSSTAWAAVNLTAPLLPAPALSTVGSTALLHINSQSTVDQTARFGGRPATNPAFASIPLTLSSVAVDSIGQPIVAGSVAPTASSNLLATETYDLPLYNSPTAALPSTVHSAVLSPGSCSGSLCAGSAAFLAKLNSATAPALALSTDNAPNIVMRNLGSVAAANLQFSANGFTLNSTCPTLFPAGGECNILLTGSGPGNITAQATNAASQTVTLPATSTTPNPIVVSPHELDFGIQTSTSPAETRTLTITNLSQQTQAFASSGASNGFTEQSSDCAIVAPSTKSLPAGATCHIILSFTASSSLSNDGPISAIWVIGSNNVALTGFSQATSLNLSASRIDFGTQFLNQPALNLPRYLYLSNNSASSIAHTMIALPSSSPFTITDRCPTTLEAHTVCQIQLSYLSSQTSSDSVTLSFDQGLSVLVTGETIPQPGVNGTSANPNLSVSPTAINFANPVVLTNISQSAQTVTISNTGIQPIPLLLSLTGDFTDSTNCPTILAGASNCTVSIIFAPSQPGVRQGLLTVSTGAGTTPVYVNLSGTGTPILTANNGIINFGDVVLDQPAINWYKVTQPFRQFTVSTPSPDFSVLLVEDVGYGHGNPPFASFSGTATGTCFNCWIGVAFRPSATGFQNAALSITSNTSGNPYALSLTGNGVPLSGLVLTPTQADFGPVPSSSTSGPTLFTLTNYAPTTVTISPPVTTGDFAISTSTTGGSVCNGPLAPSASCFIQITFSPSATGPRTGSLTLTSDTTAASSVLSGYGSPDTGLALNPTSLTFSNVPGTTSTQQTIILTNTGPYTLQVSSPTTTSFNFAAATTCTSLAPTVTCSITVTFTPSASTVTDTLSLFVTSSAPGSPANVYTIPLAGTYTNEQSGLQIVPAQADYGSAADRTLGLTRQFTLNNLTAKSLTLSLRLPHQFVLTEPPCSALSPHASCTFSVNFLPLTNGDITGTLFAQATPTDGSATLNGLGYVEGYGIGSGTLTITGNILPGRILDFGQVASGQKTTRTVTLTNSGSAQLTVRRVSSEWPFLATTTCGTALVPGQSCTVAVTYSPLNQAATGSSPAPFNTDSGSLIIESDAASSPDILDLTGTTTPAFVSTPSNAAPLVAYIASQNSLTFAATSGGNASASQAITLTNTGTASIHVTALTTTPDFTVTGVCPVIVPGTSCPLSVTFTPTASSAQAMTDVIDALEISSDSSASLDFISLFGTATPSTLVIAPSSLDFGSVLVGNSATLPIQITNASPNPAIFTSITTTGDYISTNNCPAAGAQLAPSASCAVQVTFTPSQAGSRVGTLNIANTLTTLPLVAQLTGSGAQAQLQVTPASFTFPSVVLGASATQTLSLANTGTAPINNLALTITGDFAIKSPCSSTVLAPGASCAVTISFTPTATDTRTGSLTITSEGQAPFTVPLTGTGILNAAFSLTVNGGATASVTLTSGQPANYNLTITPQNGFTGTVVLNCSPITPGQYATCSLLPSSVTVTASNAQNSIATINTVTEASTARNHSQLFTSSNFILCAIPMVITLRRKRWLLLRMLFILSLGVVALSQMIGCGSGGSLTNNNSNLRYTPPGSYQYQVTATSTTGTQIAQTVILNLTVTAQ
jgi:hypothetical protein